MLVESFPYMRLFLRENALKSTSNENMLRQTEKCSKILHVIGDLHFINYCVIK